MVCRFCRDFDEGPCEMEEEGGAGAWRRRRTNEEAAAHTKASEAKLLPSRQAERREGVDNGQKPVQTGVVLVVVAADFVVVVEGVEARVGALLGKTRGRRRLLCGGGLVIRYPSSWMV